MVSKKVPNRLWGYSLVHQAGISSMIACGKTGRTGIESVNVQTSEISECMGFDFYDHVWWLDKTTLKQRTTTLLLGDGLRYHTKLEAKISTRY